MINFRQYPNCTKIVIPSDISLSTTNFSGAFTEMRNLQYLDIDKNIENKIDMISNGYSSGALCSSCINLINRAICGDKVTYMVYVYQNCTNLTTAVCGNNVTNMSYAYNNCTNIQGDTYFYQPNISSIGRCFYNRNTSNMLNIYVQENSKTMNTCLISNTYSLTGSAITWTNDSTNKRYYNTSANIYIYPVANVYKAEETAMLQDFTYDDNGDGTYTLTGWKETYQGKPSTEMVIPDSPKVII